MLGITILFAGQRLHDVVVPSITHTVQDEINDAYQFINGGYQQYSLIQHAKRAWNDRYVRYNWVRTKLHSTSDIYQHLFGNLSDYIPNEVPNIAAYLRGSESTNKQQNIDWAQIDQYINKRLHDSSNYITNKQLTLSTDELYHKLVNERQKYIDNVADDVLNTMRHELKQSIDNDKLDEKKQRDDIISQLHQLLDQRADELSSRTKQLLHSALADSRQVWKDDVMLNVDSDIKKSCHTLTSEIMKQVRYAIDDKTNTIDQQLKSIDDSIIQQTQQFDTLSKSLYDDIMNAVRREFATKAEQQSLEDKLTTMIHKLSQPSVAADIDVDSITNKVLHAVRDDITSYTQKSNDVSALEKRFHELRDALDSIQSSYAPTQAVESLHTQLQSLQSQYNTIQQSVNNNNRYSSSGSTSSGDINVQDQIDRAIEHYAADWTEQIDYALKSSGGQILAHSTTHQPIVANDTLSTRLLSYIRTPVYSNMGQPDQIISSSMSVGHCWPMNGVNGWIIIKLREPILPTMISIQHISPHIVPDNTTTPQHIRIYGIDDTHVRHALIHHTNQKPIGELLGEYRYVLGDKQLQQFTVNASKPYNVITVAVIDNYGNPHYTCLYRVRVHGNSVLPKQSNAVQPLHQIIK